MHSKLWSWCFRAAAGAIVVATFGAPLVVPDGSTDPVLRAALTIALLALLVSMVVLSVRRARREAH